MITICNMLHDNGHKYIEGRPTQHSETYTIHVNLGQQPFCDIAYVPKIIYSKIPSISIGSLEFVHPAFITIDYLRIFTDPLMSYFRLEKAFYRFYLLGSLAAVASVNYLARVYCS